MVVIAFAIYAASLFGPMAIMSAGVGVLLITLMMTSPYGIFGVFKELRLEIKNHPFSKIYLYISLILTFACLLSLVIGDLFPLVYNSKNVSGNVLERFFKVWYLFLPVLVVTRMRTLSDHHLRSILKVWMTAFGLISCFGILQFFWGWPNYQVIPSSKEYFHSTLLFGHHLSTASTLIFPFFIGLGLLREQLAFVDRGKTRIFNTPYLLTIVLLGGVTLFLSFSRMLWISLPLGIIVWFVWNAPKRYYAFISLVLLVISAAAFQLPAVKERINTKIGIGTRIELWKANFEFFKERPLTGVGWRKTQELSKHYFEQKNKGSKKSFYSHAHNNFIEMLSGTGIIGLLSWILYSIFIFYLLFKLYRNGVEVHLCVGLICAWLVFHLNGLTQVNFWEGKVMHQMMWSVSWILLWAGVRKKHAA